MKPIGQDLMEPLNRRVYKLVLTGGKIFFHINMKKCEIIQEVICYIYIVMIKSERKMRRQSHANFHSNFFLTE